MISTRSVLPRPLLAPAVALAACALAVAHPGTAHAYGDSAWGISTDTLSDMIQSDMINRSMNAVQEAAGISGDARKATPRKKAAPPKPAPKSRPSPPLASKATLDVSAALNPAGTGFSRGIGADQLARLFPKDEYADRKKALTAGIIQLGDAAQRQYGIPRLNLATGVTATVAGAYAAYTGRILPDSHVKPLFQQLEGKLRAEPGVTNAGADAKATSYQTYMGLGLLLTGMQMEVEKSGNARDRAQVRQLGATTLQGLFGVDPARIRFSNTGYSVLPE